MPLTSALENEIEARARHNSRPLHRRCFLLSPCAQHTNAPTAKVKEEEHLVRALVENPPQRAALFVWPHVPVDVQQSGTAEQS